MNKNFISAKDLFDYTVSSIKIYEKNEEVAIAFQILEHFHVTRTDVLANKEIKFASNGLDDIINRINHSEPLQYILGEAEFYERKFLVNKNVLIPRPETEELVDLIIKENIDKKGLKILDIGSGSGCIPITLAKELIDAEVYSIDVSEEALKTSIENAKINSAKVDFSIFDIIQRQQFKTKDFDIIVSNPPYVLESEKKEMLPNVLNFEPALALFVPDENPLLFYREIMNFSEVHLKPEGQCYFEINEKFGEEIFELMEKFNFSEIRIIKDLNDKNRFAFGKWKK